VIEYRSSFCFPVAPEELWERLERVDRFERWLGWLSEFRLDGGSLKPGSVLSGVVAPPLPYRMRVRVDLDECERPAVLGGAVHGDLEGRARLVFEPRPSGTEVEVSWTIEMMQRPMRLAARVAHPLLRWGHDRVVEATVANFRRHLAGA
jgi:polyketide cyclase/dehydrase/lipid transport protein